MDDPTPWEDINPPMVSAPRPAPPYASLEPATKRQFRDELTACLVLVVPVGMDENARSEWLAVAYETVGHLPSDLLAIGCAHARAVADHPAKIVPAIIAETADLLKGRKDSARGRPSPDPLPQLEARPCTPEEATAILDEFGLLNAVRRA